MPSFPAWRMLLLGCKTVFRLAAGALSPPSPTGGGSPNKYVCQGLYFWVFLSLWAYVRVRVTPPPFTPKLTLTIMYVGVSVANRRFAFFGWRMPPQKRLNNQLTHLVQLLLISCLVMRNLLSTATGSYPEVHQPQLQTNKTPNQHRKTTKSATRNTLSPNSFWGKNIQLFIYNDFTSVITTFMVLPFGVA